MNSKNEQNKKTSRIKNQTKLKLRESAQDSESKVTMINVSAKEETFRVAEAQGRIRLSSKTLQLILENKIPKGNVLIAAKLAGIQAAKKTAELLPLCHPLRLTSVEVEISPKKKEKSLLVTSRVTALDRTGVEMEALTAVSMACLTIYDMVKALDKRMIISEIHLVSKSGGKVDFLDGEKTRDKKARDEKEIVAGKLKSGKVISVNINPRKSVRKKPQPEARIIDNYGLEGDCHAGFEHRQVSLLAIESIEKMRQMGLNVGPGDFAENITTQDLDLVHLPLGTILAIGEEVILEVTQIGKVCHTQCAIFKQVGQCVMPEEGIFARVLRGGKIKPGDTIHVREKF